MDELLHKLERRVKFLVEQHDHLKQLNHQLDHGRSNLAKEKEMLLARHQRTIDQIRSLLSKLKAIENAS